MDMIDIGYYADRAATVLATCGITAAAGFLGSYIHQKTGVEPNWDSWFICGGAIPGFFAGAVPSQIYLAHRDVKRAETCLAMGDYKRAKKFAEKAKRGGIAKAYDTAEQLLSDIAANQVEKDQQAA